jgi:hypothetical protein
MGFFHESFSLQSIPLRPFRIFWEIRGDIRKSRCTTKFATGVNDTAANFSTCFASVVDTGGKQWE